MNVLHISSVTLISNDGAKTRTLLTNTFGLPLAGQTPEDEYVFSAKIGGSKHFGVWPLSVPFSSHGFEEAPPLHFATEALRWRR